MKKITRYLLLFCLSLLFLCPIVGCSTQKSTHNTNMSNIGLRFDAESGMDAVDESPMVAEEEDSGSEFATSLEPEKIITTINIHLETTQFDKTNEELNKLIEKHKAYMESSNISYNPNYGRESHRDAFYTIRVPKENINDFKADLNKSGNITSENTSKEDVSKNYRDTESRLKIIEVKEKRILALLEKADKIEDIIKLENQLNETIYEKEEIKSHLMTLDDQIDYSTIYVNVQEVKKLTNQETINTGFGSRFINAISDSIFFFKRIVENLILLLVYAFPFILLIGLMAFLLLKVIKKIRKRKDS